MTYGKERDPKGGMFFLERCHVTCGTKIALGTVKGPLNDERPLQGGGSGMLKERRGEKKPNRGASTYLEVYFTSEDNFWGKNTLFKACFT